MSAAEDLTLEEAERRLADALRRGDRAAEAEVRARKAYLHLARGEQDAAVAEMQAARDIHARAGDEAAVMRADHGLGLLLARAPATETAALDAFTRAASLARKLGDRTQQMKAQHRIVGLHEAAGRATEAAAELGLMIAELESWQNWRGLVDCYRHRATLAQVAGATRLAREDYDRAVEAAVRHGDESLLLQTRIERRALLPALTGRASEDTWEPWTALAAEAEASGQAELAGSAHLQLAAECMRTGRIEEGLALAEQARSAALQASSAILYLLSCLLIAEGRDTRGDQPGVIAILLTCKVSLERQFGKPMGEPVVRVLDSLPQRWGAERFQAALAEYRRRAGQYAPAR